MDCRTDLPGDPGSNAPTPGQPPTVLLVDLTDCDLTLEDLGHLLGIAKRQGNREGCRAVWAAMGLLTWASWWDGAGRNRT